MWQEELHGIDLAWLGLDEAGYVAVFTTGGRGPVPPPLLLSADLDTLLAVEASLSALPCVSGHELLVELPTPDDFVAFAQRGLYSFDWTDVHRVKAAERRVYEPMARPARPMRLEELQLSDGVAELARACLVRTEFVSATGIPSTTFPSAADAC